MITKDLGAVSAYAYAVEKGYTGTEEEYAELMASYASVAEEAAESAESAQASATTANSAASTATNKASEATTAAQTATAKAEEAQADADAAALDASQALSAASTATSKASEAAQSASDAVTAKTAAQTAQTAAEGSATTAQTAAQTATQKAAEAAESARTLTIDSTLTQSGQAADAKAVGDELTNVKSDLNGLDLELFAYSDVFTPVRDLDGIVSKSGINCTATYAYGIYLHPLATYDSFYFIADKDMQIYAPASISSSDYYAICHGENFTGIDHQAGQDVLMASNVVRYRNTEHNLPTESSPLSVAEGDVVSFTFLKDKYYDIGIKNGKKTFRYKDDSAEHAGTATKTANSLTVTVGKLRVVVNKYNDSSIRAVNLWRANDAYIRQSNESFKRLWYNSDSDGVVKIKNEDDFIGGYHGDETQTSFHLFVDGVEYTEESTFTNLKFNEMILYCTSDVYHCNTSATPDRIAFKRNKTIVFNKDGYTVSNYWVAQEALAVIRAYMGMLSVERFTDNNYTDYLLTGYHTNHDYKYIDPNTGTGAQSDITEVVFNTIYGDVGIKISDIKTPHNYYGDVTNYNSSYDKRLKAYLAPINSNAGASLSVGTVIKAKSTIFVR